MSSTHRYAAFISYSHVDEAVAVWLQRALEGYRVPRRLVGTPGRFGTLPDRLGRIFRDREELPSSPDLGKEVRDALEDSAALIVICSPEAAGSRWVNEEIRAFMDIAGEERIYCLIARGNPAVDSPEDCFPPALRARLPEAGDSGSAPLEPLAADLRDGQDEREGAKLKLIAGLLGIGLDAFRQREQQRRYRRMTLLAASAMALLVVVSVLAATAYVARVEAERQRELAEQETATLQATMDFLIGLFETNHPFLRSGAQSPDDTAREILDRGAARIDTELIGQPLVQASLRHAIGEVYRGLGLYEIAHGMLETALESFEAQNGPSDPKVARVLEDLAFVDQTLNDLPVAERRLRRALEIWESRTPPSVVDEAMVLNRLSMVVAKQERLAEGVMLQRRSVATLESLPDPPLDYLAYVYHTLGWVLQAADSLDEAVDANLRALDLMEELDMPGQQIQTKANLATVYMRLGRLDEARYLHEQTLEARREWFGPRHPEVAYSLNDLAWVAHEVGDYETAIGYYQDAIALFSETFGADHANVALTRGNMAEALARTGRLEEAIEASRRAALDVEAALGPENQWLLSVLVGYGRVCVLLGDLDCALSKLSQAVAIGDAIGPDTRGTAMALVELAALPNAPLDDAAKDAAFDRALEILVEQRGERHSDRAEALIRFARHAAATGRAGEARARFAEALEIFAEVYGAESGKYRTYVAEFRQSFSSG